MAKRIITISREFGSGGRFIGEEVAKKLGIAYYDKDIIGMRLQKSLVYHRSIFRKMRNYLRKKVCLHMHLPDVISQENQWKIWCMRHRERLFWNWLIRRACVIIGRNADYILKDRDDVLNVFIHGDMPEKIQRIMGLYNVEEKEAVKMMADTDKRRMTNYNFYTDQKWGKASNYTLCLNSSQLGYDRCEKIIMECIK